MSWRTVLSQMGNKWQSQSNPLENPVNPVKFLSSSSRAYSIGSCFAINLNHWMKFQGFEMPEVSWGMHYNSRTVLYEVRRAVGLHAPSMDWRIVKRDGSVAYVDALRHCVDAGSVEVLDAIKMRIDIESQRVFNEADCFLITLGLSDVWESKSEEETITLNCAPYLGAEVYNETSPQQSRNRFLSVNECLDDLRQIVTLIRKNKSQDVPIVVTISPGPLKHASERFHPHVANSRSKATLLEAIFAFLDEDCGWLPVSYFPSYEFFQTNPLNIRLWQDDDRHPTTEAINRVAEAFVSSYSDKKITVSQEFTVPTFS